ncbi:MAG: hypothetical protein FWD89_02600, partial [Firmicutes bacterium]|nr:hypothetical protein [Bacillota bacterium]
MVKILFVCTGNTCRSKMAEQIAKHVIKERGLLNSVKCASAGVNVEEGDKTENFVKLALTTVGIKATLTKSRTLEEVKPHKFNYVIVPTERHKIFLQEQFNLRRVYTIAELAGGDDMPDPYGMEYVVYRRYAELLKPKIEKIIDKLV